MGRLRTIALIVSVALHIGAGAILVVLSEGRIEQAGGDTPMEVSLDPSAASGGNGPPIDAGPSEPPPQVGESTPQETPQASEPQPVETTPLAPEKPQEEKPQEEKPQMEKPQEEKPQEEQPPKPEAPPPPQETKETPPPTEAEPPPPVIKSAPDSNTPEVVASEPPPPKPVPPKPPLPKPPPPKPPPPKPPPQKAIAGGAAGGAPATGRVRTRNSGTAIDRGAQMTCAAGVRSRLRRPVGAPPRPFSVQITVSSSGALLSARLGSSSGSPSMDQAALAAVRGSAPFPACPGIGGFLPITIPFR